MWPGASVSGWYFSHPQSQYFVVGRLGQGPGRGLRRAQGHGRWPRPSAGSRRTSATSRRTERGASDLAAVLWDMDGTLVDTEPYWIESEFEIVERARRHVEPRARA